MVLGTVLVVTLDGVIVELETVAVVGVGAVVVLTMENVVKLGIVLDVYPDDFAVELGTVVVVTLDDVLVKLRAVLDVTLDVVDVVELGTVLVVVVKILKIGTRKPFVVF